MALPLRSKREDREAKAADPGALRGDEARGKAPVSACVPYDPGAGAAFASALPANGEPRVLREPKPLFDFFDAEAKAPGLASKAPGAGVASSLSMPKRFARPPKLELRFRRLVDGDSGVRWV